MTDHRLAIYIACHLRDFFLGGSCVGGKQRLLPVIGGIEGICFHERRVMCRGFFVMTMGSDS
jgi:hypothetical protein